MSEIYSQIIAQHVDLQEELLQDPDSVQVETIQDLIRWARRAGVNVVEAEQRDQLRKLLRQWAAVVYERTGEYPSVQLAPLPESETSGRIPTFKNLIRRLGWLPVAIGGGAIVLLLAAGAIVGQSLLGKSTPTPTVALPPPSESAVACPLASAHPRLSGPPVDIQARVITPRHCSFGLPKGTGIDVAGVYSGDLANVELLILVYDSEGLFYPQAIDACAGITTQTAQGQWTTHARLGKQSPLGGMSERATGKLQLFDVIVAAMPTNGLASQTFMEWFDTGCSTGSFPGFDFEDLPEGLTELDSVTVTTNHFLQGEFATECIFTPGHPYIDGPAVAVEARITTPKYCTGGLPTGTAIPVEGIYSGDLAGLELWVLVYDPESLFYPQAINACTEPFVNIEDDGNGWNTLVRLGDEGTAGQFDIVLTAAPIESSASQKFREWFQTGCTTNEFQGFHFDELPQGLAELDAIVVRGQPLHEIE